MHSVAVGKFKWLMTTSVVFLPSLQLKPVSFSLSARKPWILYRFMDMLASNTSPARCVHEHSCNHLLCSLLYHLDIFIIEIWSKLFFTTQITPKSIDTIWNIEKTQCENFTILSDSELFILNFMLATQSKKWDKSQEKDWKKLYQEKK